MKEDQMEDQVQLGKRLKWARKEKHLSMKNAGKIMGIGSSLISKHERGLSDPGSWNLAKYARCYNVSLDWLLGFIDDPRPIILNEKLSDPNKMEVLEYIKYLKHKEEEKE